MRVTNNMIMKNAASNINSTKETVNERNTQMTTQKKISKPSDDPVVAVRSLRLSTTLSQVNQYYSKNIPDATSWLSVTESALINMRTALQDCRTQSVNGSNDDLSQTDRNTILTQLTALQDAIYDEGNADYAGRTVFTGFRTDSSLTFTDDELETTYEITQTFDVGDSLTTHRYYDGEVEVPTTKTEVTNNTISDIVETDYSRIRLAYNKSNDGKLELDKFKFTFGEDSETMAGYSFSYEKALNDDDTVVGTTQITDATGETTTYVKNTINLKDADGNDVTGKSYNVYIFSSEADWSTVAQNVEAGELGRTEDTVSELGKTIGENDIIFIEETGELIVGSGVNSAIMQNDSSLDIQYTKTGFEDGELRPEYYYNCKKTADPNDSNVPVTYTKFDEDGKVINYDIKYTVAAGQTLTVNTEASNVFDSSILRDLGEMLNAVNASIEAHDKYDTIYSMMEDSQYADEDSQTKLSEWLAAAKKECDYADDNMQKLYNTEIANIDSYLAEVNLAITDLGCKTDSLNLTKTRVGDQQESVEELQSENDDVDLSQIIIDYTAAYTAYQASLTAASKLGSSTLLNYL